MQRPQFPSLGREDPLEKEMASQMGTPLPEEFHEQRSQAGYSPRVGHDCATFTFQLISNPKLPFVKF